MTPAVLLALPIVIPAFAAGATALLTGRRTAQRYVSLGASILHLAVAARLLAEVAPGRVIATEFGSWPAPFGIVFIADVFGALMLLVGTIVAAAVAVFGLVDGRMRRESGMFHPMFQGLMFGVSGAFLTGDIFNLYVWLEVMLISSFGLLVVGGGREQLDASVKYVVLNLLGTTLYLVATGLIYGMTGALNMADLARALPLVENRGLVGACALLYLLAIGMKAAIFPVFAWLPASYHTASTPVAAVFAGLLTKVGVYMLIRIFTLVFSPDVAAVGAIVGVVAGATMLIGVLGATAHRDIRRILSYLIVSHIGSMLIGIVLMTPLAMAGTVLYMIHHIVVMASLFMLAGTLRRAGGSFDIAMLGNLYGRFPLLSILFLVAALSLAGVPPLSGFWGKLALIEASLQANAYALVGIILVTGLLTLYCMVRVWNEAFWKDRPTGQVVPRWPTYQRAAMLAPIAALGTITVGIGLWTEPFMRLSMLAAEQLLDPTPYVAAVLGPAP